MHNERRNTAPTVVAILVLVPLMSASGAFAYEINHTAQGNPVRWAASDITITLDRSLAELGQAEAVEQTIIDAFEAWIVQADLPLDFTFVRGECGEPGYHPGQANENCVMAMPMGSASSHTGATTRISYSSPSGEIVDGDIIFNLDAGNWSAEGEPGSIDLFAVSLHEVGHLLGLAHSGVDEARMYHLMGYGPDQGADIHDDDIAGAAHLYADMEAALADLTCSVSAAGSSRPVPAGLSLALLALLWSWKSIRKRA